MIGRIKLGVFATTIEGKIGLPKLKGAGLHVARKVIRMRTTWKMPASNKIGELLSHRPRFVDLNGEFQVELQGCKDLC